MSNRQGWNAIDILSGSSERFLDAFGYSEGTLDAFKNCLNGEGVDVEELDIIDKKDKAARRF